MNLTRLTFGNSTGAFECLIKTVKQENLGFEQLKSKELESYWKNCYDKQKCSISFRRGLANLSWIT